MSIYKESLSSPIDDTPFEERLERRLGELIRTVPFYRSNSGTYASRGVGGRSQLALLPVLSKQTLASATFRQFVPDDLDAAAGLAAGELTLLSTSGSSETPLRGLIDGNTGPWAVYWSLWNLKGEPRVWTCASDACSGGACGAGGRSARPARRFPNPFSAPTAELRDALARFGADNANVLFVNPTYLLQLVERVDPVALFARVQLILLSYEYLSGSARAALAKFAPVASVYGATELGGTDIALGCPAGHLHVLADDVAVEEIAIEGCVAKSLLLSTPFSRTSPLLRYEIEDLGVVERSPADCLLSELPRLTLHGRRADAMLTKRGLITTKQFDDAIYEANPSLRYRVRLLQTQLEVEHLGPLRTAEQHRLRDSLGALGFDKIRFLERECVPLEPSGKFRLTGANENE